MTKSGHSTSTCIDASATSGDTDGENRALALPRAADAFSFSLCSSENALALLATLSPRDLAPSSNFDAFNLMSC